MASPQLENGYTKIANELLEKIAALPISGSEFRVLLYVMRKTYGWGKKSDMISLSQFARGTGLPRRNVIRAIQSLVVKRPLIKDGSTYKLNKKWHQWLVVKRPPPSGQNGRSSGQTTTKSSGQLTPYKRNKSERTKENFSSDSVEYRLSELLLGLIRERNPSHKQTNLQSWAKNIDLTIRIDKRPPELIEQVIKWSQSDRFWKNNILSTGKLREKFDQLVLKMDDTRHGGVNHSQNSWEHVPQL